MGGFDEAHNASGITKAALRDHASVDLGESGRSAQGFLVVGQDLVDAGPAAGRRGAGPVLLVETIKEMCCARSGLRRLPGLLGDGLGG